MTSSQGFDGEGNLPAATPRPPRLLKRFARNRLALFGLALILAFSLSGAFAKPLSGFDPREFGSEALSPPSSSHIMGTDDLGRDVASRVLFGARTSLAVGLGSALLSTVFGLIVGSLGGFYRGRVDLWLMRITELFQVIPRFFLALVLVILFGPNLLNMILAISVLSWPSTARLVRVEYMALREREFVEAARAFGATDARIIIREILPNALTPVVVNGTLQVASAILLEAGLAFLGLFDPSAISWGAMLSEAQRFLRTAWWLAVFPGSTIFLTVLAFNLLGDGIAELLNPRLRSRIS